jgi:hypothetical protein
VAISRLESFVVKTLKSECTTDFYNLKVKNYKYNKFIYAIAKIPIDNLISINKENSYFFLEDETLENKRNFTILSQNEILEILKKGIDCL